MKKVKYLIPVFCLLSGMLMSCQPATKEITLQEMISAAGSSNITYHSDQQFYYYPTGHLDKLIYVERDDVYARMDDGLYDLKGYLYGTETLVSSVHLERDVSGNVTEKKVNLNNKIETKLVMDSIGLIPWNESVYCNQIAKLKAEDFTSEDGKTYKFVGKDTSIPMRIIHAAIPTSYFDLNEFSFVVENNKIKSFLACEPEVNDVYPGDENYDEYMFGRKIEIVLEDINNTEVKQITAYEDKEENDVLKNAIQNLKNASNYTINSSLGQTKIATTLIGEADILQTIYGNDDEYQTGIHLVNGSCNYFQTLEDLLYEYEKTGVNDINFFKPSLDFSEDIFKKVKEENGEIVFESYPSMGGVLSLIDFEMAYEQEYSYKNGPIEVYVKNNQIDRFQFPMISQGSDGQVILEDLVVKYSDINNTVIDPATWDNYTDVMPEITLSGWDDRLLNLPFNDKDSVYYATPAIIFDKYLEEKDAIPFILPKGLYSNISYDYYIESDENRPDNIELSFEGSFSGNSSNIKNELSTKLKDAKYTYDGMFYELRVSDTQLISIDLTIDDGIFYISIFIEVSKK